MEEGSDDGMKVHKRSADGTDKSESAPKKAKQAEPEESEEDERNKRTLFVRNLPFSATDEQMSEVFGQYGECSCRLIMDKFKGTAKGIGFVEYGTVEEMKAAIAAQDDLWIGDRQAFVKCAADPKGPPGGDRGGRGGRDRGGRQSFGGGDRKSFGGERQERDDSATMFVKNIPFSADQDSLGALFENVKSVRLPTDRDTGRMKGFGYIEFDSAASLDSAISAGPYHMDGRDLTVDKAGNKPSGGAGGRRSFGDRGGRGGGRGFGGGRGGGRGFGGRGGGRGGSASVAKKGAIQDFAGKKKTFDDSD